MNKDSHYYRPSRPEIPFTFLYPAGWNLREIVKENYVEVFISCSSKRQRLYTPSLTASVTYKTDQTPLEAVAKLINGCFGIFTIEKKGPFSTTVVSTTVAGVEAVGVEIGYWMHLPLNTINPQRVEIRAHSIFFKQGGGLYELSYTALSEDYEEHMEAFQTLVESFTFITDQGKPLKYERNL